MSHNNQKKIAVINDFSGFGRCSIAVALPILSVMKVQCCPLPTSIFSNLILDPIFIFAFGMVSTHFNIHFIYHFKDFLI